MELIEKKLQILRKIKMHVIYDLKNGILCSISPSNLGIFIFSVA